MKVPNISEALLLDALIDGPLSAAVYHLYKNNLVPGVTTVLADFTEADFSGYDPAAGDMAAAAVAWGAPALVADGRHSTTGDGVLEWVRGSGPTSNTVYGWYLLTSAGALIAAEAFVDGAGSPAPFTMTTEGATILLTPYFSVQSRDEGGTLSTLSLVTAIVDTEGVRLTLTFDGPAAGNLGFALSVDLLPVELTLDVAFSNVIRYFTAIQIFAGQMCTLDYAPGDVEGLEAFTLFPVDNQAAADVLLRDTFTDSDGTALAEHMMNVGGGWTVLFGAWDVQSGRVGPTGAQPGGPSFLTVASATVADYTAKVTVRVGTSLNASLVVRFAVGDAKFYMAGVESDNDLLAIYEWDGSGFTLRAATAKMIEVDTDYILTLTAAGASLSLVVEGTVVNYDLATVNQAATMVGLRSHFLARFENFEVMT